MDPRRVTVTLQRMTFYVLWQPLLFQAKNPLIWAGYLWLVEKANASLWFVGITTVSIGWSDFGKMDQWEELLFSQKCLFMPLSKYSHQVICLDDQFCKKMCLVAPTLWSRIKMHPHRNDRWTLLISSNALGSRLALEPSFWPRGLRTCNVFFQKTVILL